MNNIPSRLLLSSSIIFILFIGAVFASQRLLGQTTLCPDDWPLSESPDLVAQCAAAAETARVADLREELTRIARIPSSTLPPTANAAEIASVHYDPTPTPGVLQLNPGDFADGVPNLRKATSLWAIGIVSSPSPGSYITVYALSRAPHDDRHAIIYVTFYGDEPSVQQQQTLSESWEAPMDVGEIQITGFSAPITDSTGLAGVLSFATATGQSGTLNVATGVWDFNS